MILMTVPKFLPGTLVRHRRYGYRGVVVEYDPICRADKRWYHGNRTQPNRDQPWYHVLVHDSDNVTYAAEANLLPDESGEPIEHPLVAMFFSGRKDGRYLRNSRAWPGWRKKT